MILIFLFGFVLFVLFIFLFPVFYLTRENKRFKEECKNWEMKQNSLPKSYLSITLTDDGLRETTSANANYPYPSYNVARREADRIIMDGFNMDDIYYPAHQIKQVEVKTEKVE